jgi:zinc protease
MSGPIIMLIPARSLFTLVLGLPMFLQSFATLAASAQNRATEFRLDNGMQIVVVPDRRAPVVTHMVWYRVGAADETRGVSGIAHFLEHLMFKSTDTIAPGEFSKIISRLGGQDNAFTGHDATAYFQRISKDRLKTVMAMEADRMVNLKITEQEVSTERKVILEERRSRIENSPQSILDEQMSAALYLNHPYGVPVIGWMHEMAKLSREDALTFYKRFYAPNNCILVVTGDVTPDEVLSLAQDSFGKLPANPDIKTRVRPAEPEPRAARRVELRDPRAGKASIHRYYLTPSYQTAQAGEAEALDILMKITAQGATSRLYQRLVVEDKVASSAGGWYSGSALDSGKIAIYAVAADGADLAKVESAIDQVLADVLDKGVTDVELERAKKAYIAEFVYESDSQTTLARRYGWGLAVGRTLQQIDDWPAAIAKVSKDDVREAGAKFLDLRRSVTGTLLPIEDGDAKVAVKPAPQRS